MALSRTAVGEFLDRDLDDFRWMKRLTARQILRELSQFRTKPRFKTDPWLHQLVCFYIGLCHPRFLFLLDMGLGKTKILLDLATQTLRENRLDRALVTVPRTINMSSWADDVLKHSELEPNPCDISDIEGKRDRLLSPHGDLTIIDYQGLQWALCKKHKGKLRVHAPWMRMAKKLYNWVGLDESHKLKNSDNLWADLVGQLTEDADYVYATTGTLFGKQVEDLWHQFYLVDRGETFGENMGLFREAFFTSKSNGFGLQWEFNKRMKPDLTRMLQHRSLRYDEAEVPELDLPLLRVVPPVKVEMEDEQKAHYLKALEGLINAQDSGDTDLEAPWLRMRQITSGYLAWKDGRGDHLVRFKSNPKLMALERLLTEMRDCKFVVAHDYTETGRIICDHLKHLGIPHLWLYGGAKDKSGIRTAFMHDPSIRGLVMNSEAGGTGNDGLQEVANYLFFFESPPSPTTRQQVIKRLHRTGQRKRTFVYDIVAARTVDQGILDDAAAGRNLYEEVVNGRKLPRGKLGLLR